MIRRYDDTRDTSTGQFAKQLKAITRGALLLWVLTLISAMAAVGQLTTADILGTVTDASGALVPNAHVTLTNLDTQEKRSTVTNSSGDSSFTLLQPGHYSVSVQATGFKVSTTPNLGVEAGDRA